MDELAALRRVVEASGKLIVRPHNPGRAKIMPRDCVTHYACDCIQERLKRLEKVAEVAEAFVAARTKFDSAVDEGTMMEFTEETRRACSRTYAALVAALKEVPPCSG